jgi:hypothetical protein
MEWGFHQAQQYSSSFSQGFWQDQRFRLSRAQLAVIRFGLDVHALPQTLEVFIVTI